MTDWHNFDKNYDEWSHYSLKKLKSIFLLVLIYYNDVTIDEKYSLVYLVCKLQRSARRVDCNREML